MTPSSPGTPLRPAVFLDRDGTIIHDRDYLADPAGVELLPGAAQAIARLNCAGYVVVVVTNQSGIGRGYMTEADYHAVHARMVALLAAEGAHIDAAYFAPQAPSDLDPESMRKPGAGMYLRAAREHALDFVSSWLVGDRLRDVTPAAQLGARAILIPAAQTEGPPPDGVAVAASLLDAVTSILDPAESSAAG